MIRNYYCSLLITFIICACKAPTEHALFSLIYPDVSNIHFNNQITETDSFNILTDEFMYNGGGIGVGDFNQDGLPDLYFTGNQVGNKLYLNSGNFAFEDVTKQAGVAAEDIWSSGVAVVDINLDGLPDIYISATFSDEIKQRTNKLFIHQGIKNGIPVFEEQAAAYGLADTSYTTQTYFFDYDLDGDLDAFLLNDKLFSPRSTTDLDQLMEGGEATIDKLYRNNGYGKFEDVSSSAGISFPGFGLGAAIFDVNQDGYSDIYVSNDFISNDLLYVNQKNGTFKNQINQYFKHHSFSSMGIDVADLNGDAQEEVMTLDMLPEDEGRVKRTYSFQKYQFYELMEKEGYLMQYNRNMLHASSPSGRYQDVGQLAGVDATEWSWSVLFADMDNDGLTDIAITNGYPRDITDMDFTAYNSGVGRMMRSHADLLKKIPVVKVRNYMFRQESQLQFEDMSEAWGITTPSFSNGAVTVDLDQDGDLDYVVNNINDSAHIYQNHSQKLLNHHFLRIQLKGDSLNPQAMGARLICYAGEWKTNQLNYHQRGFISSVEPILHFGLGTHNKLDSLRVFWPDGEISVLKNVDADQSLSIAKQQLPSNPRKIPPEIQPVFRQTEIPGIDFRHHEVPFHDYNFQALVPRKHSQEGPVMAVGDLNGDGFDDLIAGNGSRSATQVYLSQQDGPYLNKSLDDISLSEDMGIAIFDADQDGDQDVYLGSGSTEFRKSSRYFYDKFYLNDGQGNLIFAPDRIPQIPISSGSVSIADYDRDGDLDIFVSGRIIPQEYPLAATSLLLKNDGGFFTEVHQEDASDLANIGMVSQAVWSDIDADGWMDLVLVGEWMPVIILRNEEGKLVRHLEVPYSSGWWNSITAADLDQDGDEDFILGNQGLNNKMHASHEHPLRIYAHDFDHNGSIDPVIAAWSGSAYYPVHLRLDLLRQLNSLKKKFPNYLTYSQATISDIFSRDTLEKVLNYQAETFESAILWNEDKTFRLRALPLQAQYAPVYASLCVDVDQDSDLDILLVGNRYGTEVFEGRQDAFNGLLLINHGKGDFRLPENSNHGFKVDGDARSLLMFVDNLGQRSILAGINRSPIKAFQLTKNNPN